MLGKSVAVAVSIATAATAQGLRDGDTMLDVAQIEAQLAGNSVLFYDGSEARFGVNGDYSYRYTPEDAPFVGTYAATADSRVCVVFSGGANRCDTYVLDGDRLVLITDDGLRFPVKTRSALD